ncbi:MAG: ABC transporter ATP-binding protein, partial [Bacteroidota bacterium]
MRRDKSEGTEDTQKPKPRLNKQNLRKLKKLFSYVLPYKGYFIAGLLFLVINSMVFLVFPILPGKLIDLAQGNNAWFFTSINQIIGALAVSVLLMALFSFFRIYLFTIV